MIDAFFWFEAGYCTMYDRFARRDGAWQRVRFPAAVGLMHHATRGWILFDTGYHPRFFEETRRWPYRLMRYATKVYVQPHETASAQLMAAGIDIASIRHVLLSHVHTDHVAGVADFKNSTLWLHRHAFENVLELEGWAAVKQGVVPALMETGWKERAEVFESANAHSHAIFGYCWDMFGVGKWGRFSLLKGKPFCLLPMLPGIPWKLKP
jgi:glyoxylase-like metal-dependent hydrolase (beta-lactamase superfamily II)